MRKWIIIEDYAYKAEKLIEHIVLKHPEDKIYLIFASREKDIIFESIDPDAKGFKDGNFQVTIEAEEENIEKEISFFWCPSSGHLRKVFKKFSYNNSIVLLDLHLTGLTGDSKEISKPLLKITNNFLAAQKILLCIITTAFNPAVMKRKIIDFFIYNAKPSYHSISSLEEKVLIGNWDLMSEPDSEEWTRVIEKCQIQWKYLFEDSPLTRFLKLMSERTSKESHQGGKSEKDPTFKDEEDESWCPIHHVPKHWVWLSKLLDYDDYNDFKVDFGDEFPQVLKECLKTFGTNNTHNISPLSLLIIIFKNFRSLYKNDLDGNGDYKRINNEFVEKIKNAPSKSKIIRTGSVCPLQNSKTRARTWHTFSNMVSKLIPHNEKNTCNIESIDIGDNEISVYLKDIKYQNLHKHYCKVFNIRNNVGNNDEHLASQAIVNYLIQSYDADYNRLDYNTPFIGAEYGLKIYAKKNGGIVIKF